MKRRAGQSGAAGFTIVEMLVVIAIISVLAGLLMSGVMVARGRAREHQTKIIMGDIILALENYRTDNGDYPPGSGGVGSSEALYLELATAKGFGPYIKGERANVKDTNGNGLLEFVDAWGNPILYTRGDALTDDRDYELVSAGRDGIFSTSDDLIM